MKDVAAVCQPSDLLIAFELVKADGAAVRDVRFLQQFFEFDHREDLSDEDCREGLRLGLVGGVVRPKWVRFDEMGETQKREKVVEDVLD